MPRFVVLEHDSPHGLHWDLMLETGARLATWALAQAPDSAGPTVATALPDHRLAYLDYEGPISGGRGSVVRWDRGTYQVRRRTDTQLVIALEGQRLTGEATLSRLCPEAGRWQFSFQRR